MTARDIFTIFELRTVEDIMKKSLLALAIVLFPLMVFLQSCGPTISDVTISMLEQGRNDEVIARMRRALLNKPNNTEYMKFLGIALYNKEQYQDAITIFKKVLDSDPEDDQAAYYLGALFEATKDYDKAIL